jgi:hypothetical protein
MQLERRGTEMRTHGAEILGLLILGLAATAGVLLAVADRSRRDRESAAEEFQQLVGGLGFGPTVDVTHCPFGFDPRLDTGCQEDHGPVPGGFSFCPLHANAVFVYPPPDQVESPQEGNGDAQVP